MSNQPEQHIVCRKYKKKLPALNQPPFPGEEGEAIYKTVSAKAWQEWLQHQTRLINEKHLNMLDPKVQQYLTQQRELFFNNQAVDEAEGYIAQ